MSTCSSMIGRTSIKCHLIDLASPMPDASTRIKNTSLYIDMAITQSRNGPHFKRFAAIRTSEKCIIQVSSDPVSILTSPNTEQQLLMQTLFCELQLLHPPNMQSNLYSVSVHASCTRKYVLFAIASDSFFCPFIFASFCHFLSLRSARCLTGTVPSSLSVSVLSWINIGLCF